MLSFSGQLKIYVAVEGCDMRKSYEGLAGLVQSRLEQDLRSRGILMASELELKLAGLKLGRIQLYLIQNPKQCIHMDPPKAEGWNLNISNRLI